MKALPPPLRLPLSGSPGLILQPETQESTTPLQKIALESLSQGVPSASYIKCLPKNLQTLVRPLDAFLVSEGEVRGLCRDSRPEPVGLAALTFRRK